MLTASRYLALVFALILAVGEALLNARQPNGWQYAPLWIIDYVIVAALLLGFWLARRPGQAPVLMAGWALAAGVFYMALFVGLDPEITRGQGPPVFFLAVVALALALQTAGFVLACLGHYRANVR